MTILNQSPSNLPTQTITGSYSCFDNNLLGQMGLPSSTTLDSAVSFELSCRLNVLTDKQISQIFFSCGLVGLSISVTTGTVLLSDHVNNYDTGYTPAQGVDINFIVGYTGDDGTSERTAYVFINQVLVLTQKIGVSSVEPSVLIGNTVVMVQYFNVYNTLIVSEDNILESFIQPLWQPGDDQVQDLIIGFDLTVSPPVDNSGNNMQMYFLPSPPSIIQVSPAGFYNGTAYSTLEGMSLQSNEFSLMLFFNPMSAGDGESDAETTYTLAELSSDDGSDYLRITMTNLDQPVFIIYFSNIQSPIIAPVNGPLSNNIHSLCVSFIETQSYEVDVQVILDGAYLIINGFVDFVGFDFPTYNRLMLGNSYSDPNYDSFKGVIQHVFRVPFMLPDDAAVTYINQGEDGIITDEQGYDFLISFTSTPVIDRISGQFLLSNDVEVGEFLLGGESSQETLRNKKMAAAMLVNRPLRDVSGSILFPQYNSAYMDSAFYHKLDVIKNERFQKGLEEFEKSKKLFITRYKNEEKNCHTYSCYNFETALYEEVHIYGLDDRTSWILQLTAQCCAVLLSVIGAGFTTAKIVSAIAKNKGFLNWSGRSIQSILAVLKDTPLQGFSATQFLIIMRTLQGAGIIKNVVYNALTGVKWYEWAIVVAQVLVTIGAMVLTGGAYVAVIVAQIALNGIQIGVLIQEGINEGYI